MTVCGVNAELWHAYTDKPNERGKCPNATTTADSATPSSPNKYLVPPSRLEKWKLWPNVMGDMDIQHGETLDGLEEAMDIIWKNQHPEDCSTAKYYISSGANSGFGSELHIEAGHFARALDMGRVYILHPDKLHGPAGYFVENEFCKASGKTNLECYYQPLTHCTWEDALGGQDLKEILRYSPHSRTTVDSFPDHAIFAHAAYNPHLPNILLPVMECTRLHKGHYNIWWNAVAVSYLMRPNSELLKRFETHRSDPTLQFNANKERCISVKIRRGDKHTEMEMVEDETEFFQAAAVIFDRLKAEEDQIALSQKQPVMFVESEDPDVMESAQKWSKDNGWRLIYADIYDRRKESTTWMNKTEMVEAQKAHTFLKNPDEYFLILLTIDYHLRCSGYVCTQRSNACRIIDELRVTAAGKANRAYLDMHPCKEGQTPPCFKEFL